MSSRMLADFGVPAGGLAPSVRDLLRILFRRQRIVIAAIGLTTGFTTAGSMLLKPTYRAEAQIYIQRQKPPSLDITGAQRGQPLLTRDDVLNSEVALLLSRGVIEAAVDDMRLWERPVTPTLPGRIIRAVKDAIIAMRLWTKVEPREGKIIKLQRRLKAKAEPDSDVLTVWHISDQPDLSAEIVNTVVDTYLRLRQEGQVRRGRHEFFLAQHQQVTTDVRVLETRRVGLKASWNIVEIAQEKRLALDAQALTESRLQEAVGAMQAAAGSRAQLEKDIAVLPERVHLTSDTEGGELYGELVTMVAQLEARQAERLVKWPPDDPRVLEIARALDAVRARLDTAADLVPSAKREELNPVRGALVERERLLAADVAGLEAKIGTLQEQHERLDARLRVLDERDDILRGLDDELALLRAKQHKFLERAEEARIQEVSGPNFANAWVIHHASVPQRPTLMPLIALLLGFGLGTVLAGLLVAAAEYFDHSIHSREDLYRQLGVPVLAVVPVVKG